MDRHGDELWAVLGVNAEDQAHQKVKMERAKEVLRLEKKQRRAEL